MNKIVAGFCVCFFLLSIMSAIMDGSAGAAASTDLTQVVSETDNHIHVTDTTGFLSSGGVLMIENEKMSYTALTPLTFTGLTRGIEGTVAIAHQQIGTAVYNEDMGVLNYALGFSIIRVGVPGGLASVAMIPYNFLTRTVPRLVLWDFSFFQGDLLIVRYALATVSIGFIIYISFMAVGTIIGVLNRVI